MSCTPLQALLGLSCTLSLATASLAQTPGFPSGLHVFPGRANNGFDGFSFVSRCLQTTGASDVEGLLAVHSDQLQGVGDLSLTGSPASSTINSVVMRFYDLDDRTTHGYDLVFRSEASGGGPDTSTTGAIAVYTGIPAPKTTTPQGTGLGWVQELIFQNSSGQPTAMPIPGGTFFYGMRLKANANWPGTAQQQGDGLCFIEADYDPIGQNITAGDNPRDKAPNLTWEVVGTTATNNWNVAPFLSKGVVLNYELTTSAPILQIGAIHAKSNHSSAQGYGAAGMFPDLSRTGGGDGVSFRLTDNATHSGSDIFGLYLALDTLESKGIPPIPIGPLSGRLYLGFLGQTFLGGGPVNVQGADTELALAQVGKVPASLVGTTIYFQAYKTAQGKGAISNLAAVSF